MTHWLRATGIADKGARGRSSDSIEGEVREQAISHCRSWMSSKSGCHAVSVPVLLLCSSSSLFHEHVCMCVPMQKCGMSGQIP